ncbi:MAG TPA: tetratricopeptide repeat protein, partial [candidate division Zixibacteria bacterium]|nr:tetratricopeptide repeat protein [candidate division Zixibacteria bacterium]
MKRLLIFFILIGLTAVLGCDKAEDFDSLAKAGLEAYQEADYNEAVHLIGKALHLEPSDRDMLYHMGLSFARLDLLDSALVYMHRADILYPADYEINKELFRLCSLTEDYECALEAVRMMIANGDSEKMFWIPLADLNFFLGKYQLARKYYQLLINDDPNEGRYRWNLSECYAKMDRPDEAVRVLTEAVDRLGPNPVAYSQIAVNYIT